MEVDQLILRRKPDSFLLATNQELATLIYFCALEGKSLTLRSWSAPRTVSRSRAVELDFRPTPGSCHPEFLFDQPQPRPGTPCPKGEEREREKLHTQLVMGRL